MRRGDVDLPSQVSGLTTGLIPGLTGAALVVAALGGAIQRLDAGLGRRPVARGAYWCWC
ncbi:MAG: hypothetical protein ACM3ST_11490 [Bdellovibrio bacteriovorus]